MEENDIQVKTPTRSDFLMLADDILQEMTAFADTLANAAMAVTLKYYRSAMGVVNKLDDGDFDPVTIADRDAETAIRALITQSYPDHGIIGEEHGRMNDDADFVWVLDPVDGTRAFISGLPTWGTLIALLYKGNPVLGVIDQPYLKERYIGSRLGSRLNGKPIKTRPCKQLSTATISTTEPALFDTNALQKWEKLHRETQLCRYGLDCYAYAVVASGYMDIVAEVDLKIHDMMALIPIIEGAGGIATNWRGEKDWTDGSLLALGDPSLLDATLQILKD